MEFNIVQKLLGLTLLGTEWVLWLLIIASIVSIAIMIERIMFFSRTRLNFKIFAEHLTDCLVKNDFEKGESLCQVSPALESQVALRAFQNRTRGAKAMGESMEGYLVGQRQSLDRGLVILGTLGNNAPFIGLFGTVIGIIMAFNDLATNPAGGPSVVMAGISEALVATAVGLLVAIPAVIAFNAFNRIVKRRVANAEALIKLILSHHSS
jgi:biopolymer transport protein ExbB/TolQ